MKKIDLFQNAEIINSNQLGIIVGGNSESYDDGDSESYDNGNSDHHDNGNSDHHDNGNSDHSDTRELMSAFE